MSREPAVLSIARLYQERIASKSVSGISEAAFAGSPRSVQSGGTPSSGRSCRPIPALARMLHKPPPSARHRERPSDRQSMAAPRPSRTDSRRNKQFAEIVSEGAGEIIGVAVARYARRAGKGIRSARPDHGSLLLAAPITGLSLCGQAPKPDRKPRHRDGHAGSNDRRYNARDLGDAGCRRVGRRHVGNDRADTQVRRFRRPDNPEALAQRRTHRSVYRILDQAALLVRKTARCRGSRECGRFDPQSLRWQGHRLC